MPVRHLRFYLRGRSSVLSNSSTICSSKHSSRHCEEFFRKLQNPSRVFHPVFFQNSSLCVVSFHSTTLLRARARRIFIRSLSSLFIHFVHSVSSKLFEFDSTSSLNSSNSVYFVSLCSSAKRSFVKLHYIGTESSETSFQLLFNFRRETRRNSTSFF